MKVLEEDDLMGYDPNTNVLYGRIGRYGSVSLGDLFKVPKHYIPSGVGKVTNIDAISVTKGDDVESFWLVDLEAAVVKPDNPCDSDFMEEIST